MHEKSTTPPTEINIDEWAPEEQIAPLLKLSVGNAGQAIRYGELKGRIAFIKVAGFSRPLYNIEDVKKVAAERLTIPKKVFQATG